MKNIQEKLVVTVFGYEFQLVCSARKKGKKVRGEKERAKGACGERKGKMCVGRKKGKKSAFEDFSACIFLDCSTTTACLCNFAPIIQLMENK